ncbi:MAG TPA: FtsH protease activity modulator HflK [Bauldia sp.]|nr:FtsH protease activity modulator HflK [Bauldia sp.]
MPGIIHASGGWKGGNGGPWGQGPRNTGGSGGGSTPPDLEELLRRSQDRLRRVLPGGGGGGRRPAPATLIAIIALVVAFAAYFFFTFRVQQNEEGVVLRFGAYNRDAQPGLNFRLPYPIETVYTPEVTTINRVTVGTDDRSGNGRDIPEESLMLTGDENIVDINFTVFWKIENAADYVFNMEDPDGTVKAVAESAMREVIGQSNIADVLTQAREVTENNVEKLIQQTLDEFGAGIEITQVQLLKVDPPAEVIAAFRDVQAARADQERIQNQAQTYANQVVPEAKGRATQITAAASAYHDQVIAEAKGAADRFEQVYESYRAAPDVTRKRMYLETMEGILGSVDKVIIDDSAAKAGVVPYLPLPQLTPSASTSSSSGSATSTSTPDTSQSVTSPSSSSTSGGSQ